MTTTNIDADFDSWAEDDPISGDVESENPATLIVARDNELTIGTQEVRSQLRFPLSALSGAAVVTDVDLQFNVTAETVEANEGVQVQLYNGTGDDDPDGDAVQAKFDRSGGGSVLAQIDCSSTGSKTADLAIDATVLGNVSSPGFISLGLFHWAMEADQENVQIEGQANAGTDPATLTVVWTGGTVPLRTLMGAGT